ncbi:unnamed protein product [Blepharisma stoltei]|uniref:Uncharacterized protein n=1 Tax=Blepharisma stoltei TaxID=1481888 RepID=A0AAU9IH81_9CILI|nr:unnamed protein product [Blepharisma stoltei]
MSDNKWGIVKHGRWSPDEDEALKSAINHYGEKQWRQIADHVSGRTPIQCLHRWSKILKPGLVKGPWSAQEDKCLKEWVEHEGPCRWSHCSKFIKGRSGKQCRERWFNILNPDVKKGEWKPEEDSLIFQMYQTYGPKWTMIAKSLPGRTENSIKNRFYSAIRKIKSHSMMKCEEKMEKADPGNSENNGKVLTIISQMQQLENLLTNTKKEISNLESSGDKEEFYGFEGAEIEFFSQGLPPIYDFDMNTY